MGVGKSAPNRKKFLLYLEAGKWKCGKSPTGAHAWEGVNGERLDLLRCKFCLVSRLFQPELFQSPLPGAPSAWRFMPGKVRRHLSEEVQQEW